MEGKKTEELTKIKKYPFKRYYSNPELQEMVDYSTEMSDLGAIRFKNQIRFMFKQSPINREIVKYMVKWPNRTNYWGAAAIFMLGFGSAVYLNIAYENHILVRDPTDPIIYNSLLGRFVRYLGVRVWACIPNNFWITSELQTATSLKAGPVAEDIIYSPYIERIILSKQIENYLKKRNDKFDFVEIGEQENFELR